ncbi:cystathionine gamma-lyase-like [Planococcus citri]|uniref:cystathionine gamma-lyase-like n=1 Tax=Planococcus citri TaxID=170843 RepID=UPI0031F96079
MNPKDETSFIVTSNKPPNNGFLPKDADFSTTAIHAGHSPDQWSSMAITTPISLSSAFKLQAPDQNPQFAYSRCNNPTRNVLETCLAALEGVKYGFTFASGVGTVSAIGQLLNSGDRIICTDQVYGGTYRYFSEVVGKSGISVSFIDVNDFEKIDQVLDQNTKLIWLENPTNPLMKVIDIRAIARYVKSKNPDIIVVVDNTFLTPYFQKPLALGADISVYSVTKYMNGHTDVIMGAAVTDSETIHSNLRIIQSASGAVPSPFDCYLVDRSLKTLSIRMKQHMKNGLKVARFLENHPLIAKVLHPGLESHPGHEIAKQQWSGCSGMLSFYLKGNLEDVKLFISKLKYFTCAYTLGGFESLVAVPSLMSHNAIPPAVREKLGIIDNLVRLSVGLESVDALIEDLNQALLSVQTIQKKKTVI